MVFGDGDGGRMMRREAWMSVGDMGFKRVCCLCLNVL